MSKQTFLRSLLYLVAVSFAGGAAWLTSWCFSKPQSIRVASSEEFVWLPYWAFDEFERSPGDVIHLYFRADDISVWRERIKRRMTIRNVLHLQEHMMPREVVETLSTLPPKVFPEGLFLLGVDVDGFGKQGDIIWAVNVSFAPVILDGSNRFILPKPGLDEKTNWQWLPVDRRWCNSADGRMLDLIAE